MQAIATQTGLNAFASAVSLGQQVQISHIALGDGIWVADSSAVALQSERLRTDITEVQPLDNAIYQISATAQSSESFFVYEIGIIGQHEGNEILLAILTNDKLLTEVST